MEEAFLDVTKLLDGITDPTEIWDRKAVGYVQDGYDDEALMNVDDELDDQERENDPHMIAHKQKLDELEKRIVPEYRQRYEQFQKDMAKLEAGSED